MTPSENNPALNNRPWWRKLLRMVGMGFICYVGVILVLLFLENWLVYRPLKASQDWVPPPSTQVQDVEFASSDGNKIHAWWYPFSESKGALVYCHGNAGNLSYRGNSLAKLRDTLKTSALIFDYPGYGKSEGKPSEAGCYAAAQAAFDWLKDQQKIEPANIIIYGGSLGGGVAVELASRNPHHALVLVKTFTSLPDAGQSLYPWLPVRWVMRNQFNSLERIVSCRKPVFVAHGTTDELVPFSLGHKLFQAAHDPKEFFSMENNDHNARLPDDFYQALKRFLEKTHSNSEWPNPQIKLKD